MKILDFLARNRELRERLVESRERLFRIAYSWCHDAALADDLVQETLEKALKKSGQLKDPRALNTWLFTILNNCWRDHFRRQRETVDIDDLAFSHSHTPEEEGHRHQLIGRVHAAIESLPLNQRQVLTLVDLEGCSYIEVAEILDIPIGTVMSRLCRARRALRDRLLAADADMAQLVRESRQFTDPPRIRRVK
ncbi:MAG: RNA polymerase sigma factor [Gammaproteobacteria bacterium]|nr:MAG: RNA polymerase sigma factor [Gammaproteobacteria bacterium]